MPQIIQRIFITFLLYAAFGLPLPAAGENGAPPDKATAPTAEEQQTAKSDPSLNNEQKTSVIEFYTWSGMLPKELMVLNSTLNTSTYEKLKQQQIPELTADLRDLQWEVANASSPTYLQKIHIDRFQRQLGKLQSAVNTLEKSLTEDVAKLSAKRNEWLAHRTTLATFRAQEDLAPVLAVNHKNISTDIEQAVKLIEECLAPALFLGSEIANLQMRLESVNVDLKNLDKKFIESRLHRSTPTMLSVDFYRQINKTLFKGIYTNTGEFIAFNVKLLGENIRFLVIGCLLFAFFCGVIALSRKMVPPSSRWYPFAVSPTATTVVILAACYQFFNKSIIASFDFENQWTQLINLVTMLAVIRLVQKMIDERWKRMMFVRLSLYMVIILLFITLELPQILMLLFAFGGSLAAFLIYISQLHVQIHKGSLRFLRNTWGALPLSIIVTSLSGYNQLAIFIFSAIISSIGICLIFWMLFHLICGLLSLLLWLVPSNLVSKNIATIVKSLQPFIALVHLLMAVGFLTVLWDLYPSSDIAVQAFFNFGFDIAGLHISPGFMLTIFIILYGATLFSRAVQALLTSEVLPHYNAEKGVQLSINRLVHYAILAIGFLIMLKVLGFELQQLTILGGALGVGIGFGLQAIVSNFVGGLILLFERPVKVGDTIQVGTELGEVKNLGLRATIIQTFDNSEIVVPNSDLVTGQVTNWTLDERKVRVRVPVGVAYGTDVAKVLEILKSCADSHPMVLNSPKPMALFKAFGASSLDFELRFWIPEFLDRTIATSELNQVIESEFALNNIEIPFPQTDLHIRSVSDTAAKAFGRGDTVSKQGDEPPAAVNDMETLQSNEVARVSPVEHEAENRPEPR